MRPGVSLGIALAIAVLALSTGSASPQPLDCGRLAAEISALNDRGQRPANQLWRRRAKTARGTQPRHRTLRARLAATGASSFCSTMRRRNAPVLMHKFSICRQRSHNMKEPAILAAIQRRANSSSRATTPIAAARPRRHRSRSSVDFSKRCSALLCPIRTPSLRAPQIVEVPRSGLDENVPHGGSQAVCVRSCDGGFFPLNLSVRQSDPDQLANLCQALCPNVPASVFTRSPNQPISTAVSLDGQTAYSDLPNALKFEKSFDPACTCKPPGQGWAEALAGAEELLGRARKTDIVVTPETSAELAKPAFQKTARPPSTKQPSASAGPEDEAGNAPAAAEGPAGTEEVTGPDGVKRRVRIIVPPL